MSPSRLLPAVATLAVIGCSGDSDSPQPTNNGAAAAVDPHHISPPPEADAAHLILAPDGLQLVSSPSGATRTLPFGMPQPQLLAAMTRVRGVARDVGLGEECGAGPLGFAAWHDGLILWFQDNRFAGWALNRGPAPSRLTTLSGVGLNVPRREAERSIALDVSRSTLGTEFNAGGLSGLLDGPQPDDRITALWAGVTCMFR